MAYLLLPRTRVTRALVQSSTRFMSSAPSGGNKPPSQIPRSSANKSNKSKVQKISLATRASAPGAAPKAASGGAPLSNPEPTSSSPEHRSTQPSLDPAASSGTDGAPSTTPPTPTPAPTAVLPTLDFSASSSGSSIAPPDGAPQQQTGAKSAGESLSSNERQRRFLARMGMGCVGLGLIGAWLYQGREWGDEEEIPKGVDVKSLGRIGRANARISEAFDYFNKPAWQELLPPPLPAPHQRPYTLVLSLDDLLVTSTWDRENGWRTAKRPGVDYFIAYLSQFYEIVIFTSQIAFSANAILEKIDPFTLYISYKLFRESTRSVNGEIVKDLTYLNRDLSKVITIDTVPEHVSLQPENAIILPKWKGDAENKAGLIGLIPFLESIAIHRAQDVRPILTAYAGKDVAVEYAKKEADSKRKHVEEWERSGKSSGAVGGVTLSGLFGMGSSSSSPKSGPPLTYLEQKRKEAQEFYKSEQEFFKSQEAEMQKFIEDEKARQAKEMGGSLFGMLTGASGPGAILAKEAEKKAEEEAKAAKARAT